MAVLNRNFRFHFPRLAVRMQDMPEHVTNVLAEPSWMSRTMKLIAIVDDEPAVGKAVASLMDLRGYETAIFESAEAFLDHEKPESFKFLIVDYRLGEGIDGCQLLTQLRRDGIDTPAILLSGNIDAEVERLVDGITHATIVTKPCPPMRLLQMIDQAVSAGPAVP